LERVMDYEFLDSVYSANMFFSNIKIVMHPI
jgi:hypothetical protein